MITRFVLIAAALAVAGCGGSPNGESAATSARAAESGASPCASFSGRLRLWCDLTVNGCTGTATLERAGEAVACVATADLDLDAFRFTGAAFHHPTAYALTCEGLSFAGTGQANLVSNKLPMRGVDNVSLSWPSGGAAGEMHMDLEVVPTSDTELELSTELHGVLCGSP